MSKQSDAFFAYLESHSEHYGYDADRGTTESVVYFEELKDAYPNIEFATNNGGSWWRKDAAAFRNLVVITESGHRPSGSKGTIGLQLGGKRDIETNRAINKEIRKELQPKACVVLACHPSGGCAIDHKDGRYRKTVDDVKTQEVSQFQPLHPVVNTVKREHCKSCTADNKRFDARRLGYAKGWTMGGIQYKGNCIGCYWYDPVEFNAKASTWSVVPQKANLKQPIVDQVDASLAEVP